MSIFERIAKENLPCEICGKPTIALAGAGWEHDRIVCSDRDCEAEIVFPTTTTKEPQ